MIHLFKNRIWLIALLSIIGFSLSTNTAVAKKPTEEEKQEKAHLKYLKKKGWSPLWSDEFNGDEINSNYWSHEVNCWGGGNNEQQCYTDRSDNSYVDGGYLHIVSKEEPFSGPGLVDDDPNYDPNDMSVTLPHTSARLRTKDKFDFKYGRIEVKAKMADGQGMWPAIWMLPTDYVYGGWPSSGEIDIFESFNPGPDNTHVAGTLHYGLKWPQWKLNGADYVLDQSPAENFHVYAVEWEADEIRWYVDNNHYLTQTSDGWYNYVWEGQEVGFKVANPRAPFDENFHIILNQAVGGDPVGPVTPNWGDDREMLVDYVRVYQCTKPKPKPSESGTGAGCETVNPEIVTNEGEGAPGENGYVAYANGDTTVELDINNEDSAISNTLIPGVFPEDGTVMIDPNSIGDNGNTVWQATYNGTGSVFLSAQEEAEDSKYIRGVSLVGGAGWSNAGQIEFDMLVESVSEDSKFIVKLDSGWPNLSQVNIDTPPVGVWTRVAVRISDILANPNPVQPGAVDLNNVINLFLLEHIGAAASVKLDNIKLQCAFNGSPEEWQQDKTCDMIPRLAPVAASLPVDMEEGGVSPVAINDFAGGVVTIVDNPYASGVNASAKAGQMQKFPAETYGGSTLVLDGQLDFSTLGEVLTMMVWSPRAVMVLVKLESDPSVELNVGHSGFGWEEMTFDFTGITTGPTSAITLIFDLGTLGAADTEPTNWTFYFDDINLTSGGTGGGEPTEAAPTPTVPASDVISLFSDAYTNISGIDYNPNWNQDTVVTQVDIAGNNTLKYAGLNYQGTDFSSNHQDVSGMSSVHLDYWTADSTALNFYLISPGPVETAYSLPITPNTWNNIDIPLSAFAPVYLGNVFQLKFDGTGTIFLDNIYFSTTDASGGGGGGTGEGELAINGDFETGDFSGWAQYPSVMTTQSIVMDPTTSSNVARLFIPPEAGGVNNVLKQERLYDGEGVFQAGDTIKISFDYRGEPGEGILFAKSICETSGGICGDKLHNNGVPFTSTASWTTYTDTFTLSADVSAYTLEFAAVCGGTGTCVADYYIDNVSITKN